MSYVRGERSRRPSTQSDLHVLRFATMWYDVRRSAGEEHSTCTVLVEGPEE
jgi:hypothetical protein